MATIKKITGRQFFDSRGFPTSTDTVGNPLLSKNCLPIIFLMVAIKL